MSSYTPLNILVTGGCGFIGSAFINMMLQLKNNCKIVNIDCLNYCSNIKNIDVVSNYIFVHGNIVDKTLLQNTITQYDIDTVVHFAAQSHVDNSFQNSLVFTNDNIVGTHILLECIRENKNIKRFIHMSTDEVYGDMGNYKKTESSVLCPTNPYAATKASAELLVQSYYYSYNIPAIIIRSNNVYGPRQYVEKVIPKFINQLLNDKECFIHGSGESRRSFLYIDDIVSAVNHILQYGEIGEIYNISSDYELTILQLLNILRIKICPTKLIDNICKFVQDRPYNDKRYHICDSKLRSLGWKQTVDMNDGLDKTIEWYKTNMEYWST